METRSKATAQSDCSSDHEVDQTIAKGFETQCNLSDGSQHQEFPPSNDPEIVFNYNHQGKSDFDRHESARRGYKPPSRTNSLDRKSKEALGLDQMLDQHDVFQWFRGLSDAERIQVRRERTTGSGKNQLEPPKLHPYFQTSPDSDESDIPLNREGKSRYVRKPEADRQLSNNYRQGKSPTRQQNLENNIGHPNYQHSGENEPSLDFMLENHAGFAWFRSLPLNDQAPAKDIIVRNNLAPQFVGVPGTASSMGTGAKSQTWNGYFREPLTRPTEPIGYTLNSNGQHHSYFNPGSTPQYRANTATAGTQNNGGHVSGLGNYPTFPPRQHSPSGQPRRNDTDGELPLPNSLGYFDGKKNAWRSFKARFKLMAQQRGWTENQKRLNLIFALRGNAADSLADAMETDISYDELCQRLETGFGPAATRETYWAKLQSRTKEPDETYGKFLEDLKVLVTGACPEVSSPRVIDNIVLQNFHWKVEDGLLKTLVSMGPQKSFEEVKQCATVYEASNSGKNSGKKKLVRQAMESDFGRTELQRLKRQFIEPEVDEYEDYSADEWSDEGNLSDLDICEVKQGSDSNKRKPFDLREATCYACEKKVTQLTTALIVGRSQVRVGKTEKG